MAGPSRRATDDAEQLRAWVRLRDLCPPGWRADGLRLTPIDTPRGYWLRRQTVVAGCARSDCRRRCEFDLEGLVRGKLADEPMAVVLALLRCHHWNGCGFELRAPLYPQGVPLICYVGQAGVMIEIACTRCEVVRRRTPEQVIEALRRARQGDGGTGIHILATKIRGPCPGCRSRQFVAVVKSPPAMGTPGYPSGT